MADSTFSITELAREFGLTTRAIRFYEDQGLLSPHREGRSRIYATRDRVRLKLTLRGKRLGLSLSEIRELIDMYDAASGDDAQLKRFLEVLSKRRQALEQQREDIEVVLEEIDGFERQCRGLLGGKPKTPGGKRAAKRPSSTTD